MTRSRRLKKYFTWLLTPAAAVIYLQSTEGIAQIVAARFGPEPGVLAASVTPSRRPPRDPPFHATSASAIVARNPFDSQFVPPGSRAGAEEPEPPPGSDDPINAPTCDGLRVSSIVSSADPEWSLATFEESIGTGTTGSTPPAPPSHAILRRRGGEVGDRRVEFIAWDRVWMASPRGRCQVSMFAPKVEPEASDASDASKRKTTPANPLVLPPPPPPRPLEPWIRKAIETIGPTERNIDRAIIPRLLEKQAELIGSARAVPEGVNGKMVGFRVTGVTPDSILGVLGIVNGDRLQAVNGYTLTDTQSAIEAYSRLLQADRIILQVNRGGSDIRLELNIR